MSVDRHDPGLGPAEVGTHPALLDALVEAAVGDARRLGTLDRLRMTCDALINEGRHLSLRNIEAYCQATFGVGPRAQTISNDKGLHAYVEARRQAVVAPGRRSPVGNIDRAIEEILVPDLRARMRVLVEEHRLLRDRHRILTRGLARLHPPLDLDTVLLGRHRGDGAADVGRVGQATVEQTTALEKLVRLLRDSDRLARLGLESDHGDIVGRGMKETLVEDKDVRLLEALIIVLANGNAGGDSR